MEWQYIAGVLGGVVLIGNAGIMFYKWIHPALKLIKDVEMLKRHDKDNYDALTDIREMNQAQCKAMLSMINHMIDGNGIEKMKETRDSIIEIISDK